MTELLKMADKFTADVNTDGFANHRAYPRLPSIESNNNRTRLQTYTALVSQPVIHRSSHLSFLFALFNERSHEDGERPRMRLFSIRQ